jgi:ferredoxin
MSEPATAQGLHIEVDRELCFGFGDCVATAPRVFALDEHNVAIVIDADGAAPDLIVEAAQNCPVDAITITDADGVQIYP